MFDTIKLALDPYESKFTSFDVRHYLQLQGFKVKRYEQYFDDSKPYAFIESYTKGNIKVGLCAQRRPMYYTYPHMILTIHLSHFSCFNEFINFIKEAYGEFADYILTKAELIRVDCCFETTDTTLERVFTNFRRKYVNKKNHRVYGEIE